MRRLGTSCLAIALTCGCTFSGASSDTGRTEPVDASVVDAVIPPSSFRRPITISLPALTGTATSVPIAIQLDSDAHLLEFSRPDGTDLFVLTNDGSQLPLEIETKTGGSLLGWVVVPEISAPTTIYLHYGSDDPATGNELGPWTDVADLVWHMTLDGNTSVADSSPASLTGTSTVGTLTTVAGVFGSATEIDDASLQLESQTTLNKDRDSFTVSMWFRQTQAVGGLDTAFFKGGPTVNTPGYQIEVGTGAWSARVRDNDNAFPERGQADFADSGAIDLSAWHHLVMTLDRSGNDEVISAYFDGELAESVNIAGNLSSLNNTRNARVGGVAQTLRGSVDEVVVLPRAASASWVALTHANGQGTLLTIDGPEAVDESSPK